MFLSRTVVSTVTRARSRWGRCPDVRAVAVDKPGVQMRPVDLAGQLNKLVGGVEQLVEMGLEKFKRIAWLGFGLHGIRS